MLKPFNLALFSLCLPSIGSAAPQHQEPCALLGDLIERAAKENQTSPKFPGNVAYDCLQSIPFKPDPAVTFLDQYRKWLEFQSNIDILRDPPPAYPVPGVDLKAGLDDIKKKAVGNAYQSQFDFDSDIVQLILAARDEHLSVKMCSINVVQFTNDYPLVSISKDGIDLPEVYTHHDGELQRNGVEHVSPVTFIDGVAVSEYLAKLSQVVHYNGYNAHDPDAQYNNLFPSNAHTLGARSNGTGGWAQNRLWPGSSHTLKFKNSTEITVETHAQLLTPLTHFPWRDGPSLYDKLCVNSDEATQDFATSPESIKSAKRMPLDGYPEPFTRSKGDEITGYLPDHPALKDVAVLSVPTFGTIYTRSFSRAAKDLIKNATARGRSKIIIDISSNTGGVITSALDLFKMFFPEKLPYTASRYRAHDGLNLLGKVYPNGDPDDGRVEKDGQFVYWAGEAVTPDLEHNITSWQKLYGPYETVGMNSTMLISTTNTKLRSTEESPVSGYGPIPLDPKTAPFKAEDIVIVSDGMCGSACAMFAELMLEQNVKSIAFGGRPQKAEMQTIGAVRGGILASLTGLSRLVTRSYEKAVGSSGTDSPLLTRGELQSWNETLPNIPFSQLGVAWEAAVNIQNAFAQDDDELPMQFTYEPAGCRRFYTAENVLSQESVWADASKAVFGNGGCVH
ncbi:hypothetical protein P168DRAFT_335489 [Aspergillus campestris IBT 28561]|uniref:Uncharacterized protein n=1 Tax=Aspergillus campestris (strain IBT 28561) TaxID=1392248 RepID=A0A2I1CSU8_ASPC2|nr:uncharacterized protein P168DRAFT_335489 [Aspergillus campestris IBT 28561]PKY00694.1 hypothetical protein P168DRAFT_335489 [Aspergillus campestris IBT 28561]